MMHLLSAVLFDEWYRWLGTGLGNVDQYVDYEARGRLPGS